MIIETRPAALTLHPVGDTSAHLPGSFHGSCLPEGTYASRWWINCRTAQRARLRGDDQGGLAEVGDARDGQQTVELVEPLAGVRPRQRIASLDGEW